jgi:hypothetical protein
MLVSALAAMLIGFLAAPAHAEPSPSCGDSIQVTGVSYDWTSQTLSFVVVGVDLQQWLGTGYGTMEVYVWDVQGTHYIGAFNASGTGGARSPAIAAANPDGGPGPTVTAILETAQYTHCRNDDMQVV